MSPAPFNVLGQCYQFCFMGCGLCFCTTQFITCLCSFELVKPRGRHGVSSIPELELMVNSHIGIDHLKTKLELRNFEFEVSYKTLLSKN